MEQSAYRIKENWTLNSYQSWKRTTRTMIPTCRRDFQGAVMNSMCRKLETIRRYDSSEQSVIVTSVHFKRFVRDGSWKFNPEPFLTPVKSPWQPFSFYVHEWFDEYIRSCLRSIGECRRISYAWEHIHLKFHLYTALLFFLQLFFSCRYSIIQVIISLDLGRVLYVGEPP